MPSDDDLSLFGDAPLFPEGANLLDTFRDVRNERKARLNIPAAVEANPEEQAEAVKASKESGIPAEIIRNAKGAYTRIRRQQEIEQALAKSPALRVKFADPNFAALSAADMKTLSELEQAAGFGIGGDPDRAFRELRGRAQQAFAESIGQPEPSVGSWIAGVADTIPAVVRGDVASLMALSADLMESAGAAGPLTGTLQGMADLIHEDEKIRRIATTPKFESDTARYVFEGTKSTAQFLFNIAVTGGNVPAALGLMGAETGLEAYPRYRGRGAKVSEALLGSFMEGGIEVLTERIPLSFVLNRFGKVGWKAFMLGLVGREVPTEQLATFFQDMTDAAIANPDMTWGEFWASRPEAAYGTLIATLTQVGLVGGAGAGVQTLAKRYLDSSEAVSAGNTVEALSTLAEVSELAKLAPDEFKSFMDDAGKQGELSELHITPEDMEDALEQSGIDPDTLPDDIKEQFVSAGATGSTIEIPLGTYLAQMAKTPFGKAMLLHLRKSAESMSQAEAQSFLENKAGELEQSANKILDEQDDAQAAKQEAAAVKDFYVEQLGKAKRFTKDVNNMYASLMRDFYVTMAARAGMTPTELLEQYQVSILRTAPAEAALKQLADQGLVAAIRKDESGEIVKGKPKQGHAALAEQEGLLGAPGVTMGFMDAEGKFYTRGEAVTKFQVQEVTPLLQADKKAPRGGIYLPGGEVTPGQPIPMTLPEDADLSTFLHESGHFFLGVMTDLAGREGIPADVVADVDAALKWLGVKDLATWQAMSLEKKRPFHEKWAEGFELYLFEGKAPSPEMQSMFARFRQWMLRVYRSMDAFDVSLSDEVRGVFGRMLASEDSIRATEKFEPLFSKVEGSGLSESDFGKYVKLPVDATDEAVLALEKRSLRNMKWMRDARSRVIKKLQKDTREIRKAVREEAADDVLNSPLYRAYAFLRNGKGLELEPGVSHRLDIKALQQDIDPALWDSPDFRQRFTVKTRPGMHPDEVAEAFGLPSGEELIRFLNTIDPPRVAIEAATDVIMIERHGDLVDPDQVERAADEAIHNEFRAKAIRMELKALSKLANAPKYNITRRAAKAAAVRVASAVKLSALKPSKYTVAAARLGREAKKALGEGNLELAAIRKREQLVSFYVAKELERAKTKTDKARKAMLRFDLKKVRKTLDAKDLVQIDALLDRYELRPMSKKALEEKQVLSEWLAELEEEGIQSEVSDWLRNETRRQHYSTLTFEEFMGLYDAVRNMAHMARSKRKSFLLAKAELIDNMADSATDSIVTNARRVIPERRIGLEKGSIKKLSAWTRGFRKEHRNFASLLRQMDGNKDDGVLWNMFVRQMDARASYQVEENAKATLKVTQLMAPVLKEKNLTAKLMIPAVGKSYTREERIGFALNAGNAINKERVMRGEKWTKEQFQAVLDTLTKTEMDFVQSVWDYLETFKPAISEKEIRLKGIEPEWVQAEALYTRYGTYRGGYYPIRYDPLRDTKAQEQAEADVQRQMRRGIVTRTYTRRGHLEARAESTGRPMRYDFVDTLTEHIEQVVHDLAWHEWLVDTNKLLRATNFKNAVVKHYGMEVYEELNKQIDALAVGYVPAQTRFGKGLSHIRKGTSIVGLGWRITTSLVQPLGLIQGMVRVGPKWVAQGFGEWMGDSVRLENTFKQIKAESSFMRHRPINLMREVSEIRGRVRAKSKTKRFVQDTAFVFLVKMQLIADIPIYLGAKAKALAQPGMDEAKAVALAEQAVRDTQGSGHIADLATIQRKDEWTKMWTNFMSFFIRTYNITAEQTSATNFAKPSQVAGLMLDYLMLFTIPATLSFAMREALKGGDKEPEELAKGLILENISYLFGTMVGLREMGSLIAGYEFRGPTGTRFFVESGKLIKQISQGEVDMALAKAFLAAGGILFHIPTGQMITTLDGIVALMEGETKSPGALIAGGPVK